MHEEMRLVLATCTLPYLSYHMHLPPKPAQTRVYLPLPAYDAHLKKKHGACSRMYQVRYLCTTKPPLNVHGRMCPKPVCT